jgi:Zn-dependent protease with chaperone function
MEHADFIHLVRISEIEAKEQPDAYRRHVLWFATLGYAYVAISLIAGCALVCWAYVLFTVPKLFPAVLSGIGGITMVWVSGRALFSRIEPAEGFDIDVADAPQLFKVLRKLRKKLKAPEIHRVIVTPDFNAFITQTPRWGIIGPTRNTLAIGLPMLLSLGPQRLVSVLAHEYAHLRGGDGALAAWLYRTRLAWGRLAEYAWSGGGDNIFSSVTRKFVGWYAPRFSAKSFAMARQEEYTADRWSAKLSGAAHTQAALVEIALLSDHLHRGFWQQYWRLATQHELPPQKPYTWLAAGKLKPPAAHELQTVLHRIKSEKSGHSDTHPTTVERVAAVGGSVAIPEPSVQHAGSLLGDGLEKAIAHFDQDWWATQRNNWQRAHQQAVNDRTQIYDLQNKLRHLAPIQIERLAKLIERSEPEKNSLDLYQKLLAIDDGHPTALWRMALYHSDRNNTAALPHLETLAATQSHFGYAAASLALDLLDRQAFDKQIHAQRTSWKAQLEKFSKLEDQCAEELDESNVLDHCGPHGLRDEELHDLRTSIAQQPEIAQLWLLQRKLKTFPWRKRYVAVVTASSRYSQQTIDWADIGARLDLPGRLVCLDERWLNDIMPSKDRPALGDLVYPQGR